MPAVTGTIFAMPYLVNRQLPWHQGQHHLTGVAVAAGGTHLGVTAFDPFSISRGTLTISGDYIQSDGQTLVGGSTLVVGGLLDEQGGLISLVAGTIQFGGGFTVEYGALLSGTGTIAGNLTNAGEVSIGPGVVPTLHVTGNYAQTAASILNINLDDTCMPQLNVDGTAALDGTLDVTYLGSTPVSGLHYDLVTFGGRCGTFALVFVSGPFTAYYDTHELYLLAS